MRISFSFLVLFRAGAPLREPELREHAKKRGLQLCERDRGWESSKSKCNLSLSKDRGGGAGGEGVVSRAKWREWVTRFNQ
jgi:hypothetical protein